MTAADGMEMEWRCGVRQQGSDLSRSQMATAEGGKGEEAGTALEQARGTGSMEHAAKSSGQGARSTQEAAWSSVGAVLIT